MYCNSDGYSDDKISDYSDDYSDGCRCKCNQRALRIFDSKGSL